MPMPVGLRGRAVKRNLGVKFAGIIQRATTITVNIYIILNLLSLLITGKSIRKPSPACEICSGTRSGERIPGHLLRKGAQLINIRGRFGMYNHV
jgi:hypothetical protein